MIPAGLRDLCLWGMLFSDRHRVQLSELQQGLWRLARETHSRADKSGDLKRAEGERGREQNGPSLAPSLGVGVQNPSQENHFLLKSRNQ